MLNRGGTALEGSGDTPPGAGAGVARKGPLPRVIPVLLLKDWGLEKSIRFERWVYVGSPINAVRVFADFCVDELIVLDVMASRHGRPARLDVIEQMAAEARMPLTVGGGVHQVSDVEALLERGVDRVVINTGALDRPAVVDEAAAKFGSQCIVAGIDAASVSPGNYVVRAAGATRMTSRDPVEWAREVCQRGAGEVFLTSIDRDGTLEGYDLELVRRVTDAVPVPVIACGGAGKLDDLRRVIEEGGASAAAAGALFVWWGRRNTVLLNYPTEAELSTVLDRSRFRRRILEPPPWLRT